MCLAIPGEVVELVDEANRLPVVASRRRMLDLLTGDPLPRVC